MTCLNFNCGKPIARIEGGKYFGKILYVYDPEVHKKKLCCDKCDNCQNKQRKCCNNCCYSNLPLDEIAILNDVFFKQFNLKGKQLEELRYAVTHNSKPYEDVLVDMYKEARNFIQTKSKSEIMIDDGYFFPLPDFCRQCSFVAGPSGAGKTTYASNYLIEYKKMFPKNKIFVFSRLESDPLIDKLNPSRIKLDKDLVKDPIQPEELKNSIVLFDDTSTIPNKEINTAIQKLLEDVLEVGRHYNIYVIMTSHLLNCYKNTRTIMNECHTITIFPRASGSHQIRYCLKNYFGLDKNEINKIFKLRSRWVTISKTFPRYVLYNTGAYLL